MSAAEPAPPDSSRDSSIGRVLGVFFSPVRTFAAIARRPTWLAPLLLWTIVSAAVTFLVLPKIDYEVLIRERMEKSGQTVSEERLQSIVETQARIGKYVGGVWGTLTPAFLSLLLAAIYLGIFKAFGWDMKFRQAFGVTTHAFLPAVLGTLVAAPVIAQRDRIDPRGMSDLVRSNLGFLASREENPALHALLSSIDIFSIWVMALLVIGFSEAAGVSRGKAATVVVSLWVLYVLGKVGWAAAFS
jgi:membrane protein, antimicrobial resistance system